MEMQDNFSNHASGLDSPATGAFLITPDDVSDLAIRPRSLYVGGIGNIAIRMGGVDITYLNVSGILPVRPERVLATGTTATNIVGWV